MRENITIARPYAQAVFALAKETDALAAWSQQLRLLKQVVSDPDMAVMLKNPALDGATLADLVVSICGDALDREGRNFVAVLAEAGRLAVIAEIGTVYEQLKTEFEQVVECRISSAYALSDTQRRIIADAVTARSGKRVTISGDVDRALIGGAVIRLGDTVVDLSVKGRLETMAASMNH